MNAKPAFASPGPVLTAVAAATATCITIGTLWAVAA